MDIPVVRPPALRPGDTIGIIAPAGPVADPDALQQGVAGLRRLGFEVAYGQRIFESLGYLAGSDAARAGELMRCFADPGIRAVVCLRGGYGCARLVPLLDEKALRHHPKVFMGFSDVTTLHLYFRRRLGWVTFHGPMAISPSLATLDGEASEHLRALWTDPAYMPQLSFPELETWAEGCAEGTLVGGCLSIVTASLGTPYEIKTEGKVLFLEELGEAPYRIDRMVTQLRLAGKLDRLAGVLLGSFLDCDDAGEYALPDTLRELFAGLGVPVLANFPAGHGSVNWAMPLGVPVRLDASRRQVTWLGPAVCL